MGVANDGFRFLLELGVLASLGWWGFTTRHPMRWLLGLGLPLLVATVWATFVNPQGSHAATDPVRLVLELAIFGAGAAALAARRNARAAEIFGVLVAAHVLLTFPLDQR